MRIECEVQIDSFNADDAVSVCDKTGRLVLDPEQVDIYEYSLNYRVDGVSRFFTYVCASGLAATFDTTDKRPFIIVVTDKQPRTVDDNTLVFTRKAKKDSSRIWGPEYDVESICVSHRVIQDVRYHFNELLRDVRGYNEDGELVSTNGGETWYVWAQ